MTSDPNANSDDPYETPPPRSSLVDRVNNGVIIAGMVGVGGIVLAFVYALLFRSN